mgnify:CR=1 FL=1
MSSQKQACSFVPQNLDVLHCVDTGNYSHSASICRFLLILHPGVCIRHPALNVQIRLPLQMLLYMPKYLKTCSKKRV